MKWLAPLVIIIILIIFGAWFCTHHDPETPPAPKPPANMNANMANTGTVSNTNTAANTNIAANPAAGDTNKPANANAPH